MRLPRFHIAWVMIFVAIVALELGAIRALSSLLFRANINGSLGLSHLGLSQMIGALILGALPMVNVLAVGLLIGLRRHGSRPFLLGFETFGATALALYTAGVSLFTAELVRTFFDLVIKYLAEPTRNGLYLNTVSLFISYFVMIAILFLPQLAFALIGGFLFRHFRTRWRSCRTR